MNHLLVIPAYNEERNIKFVLDEVKREEPSLDIVVIDDGSFDDTAKVAEKNKKATVITLPHNLGIGGAVQTGFKYGLAKNYDVLVRIDGDGQHRPQEIRRVMEPVLNKEADVVIGSRFLQPTKQYYSSVRRIGQKFISFLVSIMSAQKITDSTSGFRCYNKRAIHLLNLYYPEDYPEPEEIIFLKKNVLTIREVPISVKERREGQSSLTTARSVYYMVKVILSLWVSFLRAPIIKVKHYDV